MAKFEIELRVAIGCWSHDAHRFASEQPLTESDVGPGQSCQEGMIPPAMFDDQDFAVAAKRPAKLDLAVEWRDDLGVRPRGEGKALAIAAAGALAEAGQHGAAG